MNMNLSRWVALAALNVVLSAVGAAEFESAVKWICPDEGFDVGIGKDRFYRKAFEVKPGLTNAVMRWWCDDNGTVYIDGRETPGHSNRITPPENVTALLKNPGRHVLAVRNRNLAGIGGVCLSVHLAYADGTEGIVHTGGDWICATNITCGWESPSFVPVGWKPVRVHGDVLVGPWVGLADMASMLPAAERMVFDREKAGREARLAKVLARLEREIKPVCRIVYDRGRARLDIGGRLFEPTFYNTSQSWNDANRRLRTQAAHFRDAGQHLFGVGIDTPKAWRKDGSIDFELAVAPMRSALAVDPEARFFYSINTVLPPDWWARANTNELVGYGAAEVNLRERACLKNCAAGSAASEVWRRDACDYQRRLVEYLESTPYAKRIFAYRVDWGANHEWHYYGMRGYLPDNGPAMTRAFRAWLRKAYGNDVAALRKAWADERVAFETAEVPGAKLRLRTSAGILRDPVKDRATIDYERCHAATLRDWMIMADRSVKEACGGRALVGNYAGYFFGMAETAEGWHLENDAILDSPYVDFQCHPQVYGRESRQPGGVQYARALLEGLRRRGKLGILEADNATTPSGVVNYNHWSKDVPGDLALLARDFVQTLCWGCGYWYFDFGQGWYTDPAFADFFRKIYPIRSADADCSSVSEVLLVGDYESVMFSHVHWRPRPVQYVPTNLANGLGAAGAPFDTASWRDLESGKLKDYKLYVFANLDYATPEKLALVNRLRAAGGKIAWGSTPGTLNERGYDPKGIALPGETVLPAVGDIRAKKIEAAMRKLYREAGVHVYNDDPESAVYACASYVALHNAGAGMKTIRLPRAAKVTEVYPRKRVVGGNVTSFSFPAEGPATTLFRLDPPEGHACAWPEPTREMKPWAYNWWMASAVDAAGIGHQCAEMAKAGFGGMHIIPIYGAKGYERQYREYLSPEWMKAYEMAVDTAHRYGLGVDLTMGSGWCFGGPWLKPEQGGWMLKEDGKGGLVPALTGQKVKRAGPGGEGTMMNPYSPAAMDAFLAPFTKAFDAPGVPRPEHFYHDSWEYFKAGWDPDGFFAAFRRKRGYDLRDRWTVFCGKGDPDEVARVKCDYRETLSDLVIEDVFPKWFDWCRARGIGTRNEAHGAPVNLLDFYALADIPETEMFGKNDREILVSKFASSAAHVAGKRYVSAESCTWLDDHFCERPAEIKSFVDRLFLSGVNRVFYHGLCYSPVDAVWPGWCFYAALEMNPRNPIWRDALAVNSYVTRCQSLFQTSEPGEDVLLYWPIRDLWWNPDGFEIRCTVHHREWLLDQPLGKVARELHDGGYAFDYVSDRQLARLAKPGRYATIVIPPCRHMPDATAKRLGELAAAGYAVVRLAEGDDACNALAKTPARRERLGGLRFTRFRRNGKRLYFLVNAGDRTRRVAYSGRALDPLLGGTDASGSVVLPPEHSVFVEGEVAGVTDLPALTQCDGGRKIVGPWKVTPLVGGPSLPAPYECAEASLWSAAHPFFSGTMLYRTSFEAKAKETVLDLGDVRETARARVNGFELGVRFMPPYRFEIPAKCLKDGANELEVEVTSLGSNRLRWNDLNGVKWKYFRDTNMVTPAYRPLDASKREVVPSGLAGPVTLK